MMTCIKTFFHLCWNIFLKKWEIKLRLLSEYYIILTITHLIFFLIVYEITEVKGI